MKKKIILLNLILLVMYLFAYAPFFSLLGAFSNFFPKENITLVQSPPILPEIGLNYKNGEEVLSTIGENYMLHDNQWVRIPSKKEYEKILEEIPLTFRNLAKPRKSIQSYNQNLQIKKGGDTILNSLRNANNFDRLKIDQLLNGKSNVIYIMEELMAVHDGHVTFIRNKEEQRRIYIEKQEKRLNEWKSD